VKCGMFATAKERSRKNERNKVTTCDVKTHLVTRGTSRTNLSYASSTGFVAGGESDMVAALMFCLDLPPASLSSRPGCEL
jgi:hypothetical protein